MLERRFSFYAAYHQNPVNQAIHIVCVPLIFWSSLVVAGVLLPGRVTNPLAPAAGGSASDALAPDVPTAIVLAYLAYYLVLSPKLAVRVVVSCTVCHARCVSCYGAGLRPVVEYTRRLCAASAQCHNDNVVSCKRWVGDRLLD